MIIIENKNLKYALDSNDSCYSYLKQNKTKPATLRHLIQNKAQRRMLINPYFNPEFPKYQ